ncbi:reverse transcriptase domain-containing protein [Tanacetum coccineum]|uniref:Reverse transcriptase domain-containing protein n=1 Tax=Tanacetum coccineum TaxID=301880 RepID=A0ABQ5IFC9_9ASTR
MMTKVMSSKCAGFLWCQGSMSRGKEKVAWEVGCLPKKEGGLGILRLDHFNKALMVSYIWKLLSLKESLWVKWIHVYKLRNQSFWEIPYRALCITSFLASKVRECIYGGLWSWPNDWLVKYPILNSIPVPVLNDAKSDVLEWRKSDCSYTPFSVQRVWHTIRPRDIEVPWYDLVWFLSCIPRHAVNMWLIMKKRLKTQDTLSSWDVDAGLMNVCPLCETQPDSHEHLFFDCSFSF